MSGTASPTGSAADMLARLKAVLPARWFPDNTPVLDALLGGLASTAATLHGMIGYVRTQTRVASVSDNFLDLATMDYCANRVSRRALESDASLRPRLLREMIRERGTNAALVAAIQDVTGRTPAIFEPMAPGNTGGYGVACGYGAVGGYASLTMPFQCLVTAYRPFAANAPAWTTGPGPGAPVAAALVPLPVADADIYAAIAAVTPISAIAWTSLQN